MAKKGIARCGAAELTGETCEAPRRLAETSKSVAIDRSDRLVVLTEEGCGGCEEAKEALACREAAGEVEFLEVMTSDEALALYNRVESHPDFEGFPQAVVLDKSGNVKALPAVEEWVEEGCPR